MRCSVCGGLFPSSAFTTDRSRPLGKKTRCRDCENARSVSYYHAVRKHRQLEAIKLKPPRLCKCGKRTVSNRSPYCRSCREEAQKRRYGNWRSPEALERARQRERERKRDSVVERGYGNEHRRLRKKWVPIVASGGVRCARGADCKFAEAGIGGLIVPGQSWDLGHDDQDRTRYIGPEHSTCNRATTGRQSSTSYSREWL